MWLPCEEENVDGIGIRQGDLWLIIANANKEEMQTCFELWWKVVVKAQILDTFADRLQCDVGERLESRLMPSIWISVPGRLKLVLVKMRKTGVRSFAFIQLSFGCMLSAQVQSE